MKKLSVILSTLIFFLNLSYGQIQINWQQSFGGMGMDYGYDIVPTVGGYLVIGSTNSTSGQVSCNTTGESKSWLIKIDPMGNLLWQKCYSDKYIKRIDKAYGSSDNFLVGGAYGEPYLNTNNLGFVRIDSLGNIIWEKVFGNSVGILDGDEFGVATNDGGAIGSGQIMSNGGDVTNYYGGYDGWVIKVDSLGNKQWDFTMGSSQFEFINCVYPTSDNGYLAGLYGTPDGEGGNIDCSVGFSSNSDAIVFKLDSIGDAQWHNCYGGSGHEGVVRVIETDNGYIIAAIGGSDNGDLTGSGWHGDIDVWLVNIDFQGNIIWQKCYGGTEYESPKEIFRTSDGGYVVFANTTSFNGDVSGNPSGGSDVPSIWVFKVNSTGDLLWQRCLGGVSIEDVYGAFQNSDYNYAVAGEMRYSPSGDVNCSNYVLGSYQNYWVFGISDTTVNVVENEVKITEIKVYPNPANSILNIDFPVNYDTKNSKIEIVDIHGKTVIKSKFVIHSTQLDTKRLTPGIYTLKIQNDKTLVTRKIIIQ